MGRRTKKIISLITLGTFVLTQGASAAPVGMMELPLGRETPAFLQIDIPPELATVDEIYEAPPKSDPQLVIHLQTAHGSYEAQVQIKKILAYLHDKYGFNLLFVEGSADKLNPDYLKLFPKQENNIQLAEALTKKGEMTGVEYYLMDAPKDMAAYGIEKPELYRENYKMFKEVYGAKSETDQYLNTTEARLEKLSSRLLSNDTRRLLADWKKFQAGHRDFLPFVKSLSADAKKILGLDLESLFAQVEWPQMARLLVLQSMEPELNKEQALAEKKKLIEFLKSKKVSGNLIADLERLEEKRISMARGQAGQNERERLPRYLLERLADEAGPKGFNFYDYPSFSLYAGYLILQSELEPKVLFEEIEQLFDKLLNELALREREKNLLELFRDTALLRQLFSLELARKDWARAFYRRNWLEQTALANRVKAIEDEVKMEALSGGKRMQIRSLSSPNGSVGDPGNENSGPPTKDFGGDNFNVSTVESSGQRADTIDKIFESAFKFYDYAREREVAFYETLQEKMHSLKSEKAILVTGGFHTEGISDLLREKGINYGILTPRLSERADSASYITTMMEDRPTMFDSATIEKIGSKVMDASTVALMGGNPVHDKMVDLTEYYRILREQFTKGSDVVDALRDLNSSERPFSSDLKKLGFRIENSKSKNQEIFSVRVQILLPEGAGVVDRRGNPVEAIQFILTMNPSGKLVMRNKTPIKASLMKTEATATVMPQAIMIRDKEGKPVLRVTSGPLTALQRLSERSTTAARTNAPSTSARGQVAELANRRMVKPLTTGRVGVRPGARSEVRKALTLQKDENSGAVLRHSMSQFAGNRVLPMRFALKNELLALPVPVEILRERVPDGNKFYIRFGRIKGENGIERWETKIELEPMNAQGTSLTEWEYKPLAPDGSVLAHLKFSNVYYQELHTGLVQVTNLDSRALTLEDAALKSVEEGVAVPLSISDVTENLGLGRVEAVESIDDPQARINSLSEIIKAKVKGQAAEVDPGAVIDLTNKISDLSAEWEERERTGYQVDSRTAASINLVQDAIRAASRQDYVFPGPGDLEPLPVAPPRIIPKAQPPTTLAAMLDSQQKDAISQVRDAFVKQGTLDGFDDVEVLKVARAAITTIYRKLDAAAPALEKSLMDDPFYPEIVGSPALYQSLEKRIRELAALAKANEKMPVPTSSLSAPRELGFVDSVNAIASKFFGVPSGASRAELRANKPENSTALSLTLAGLLATVGGVGQTPGGQVPLSKLQAPMSQTDILMKWGDVAAPQWVSSKLVQGTAVGLTAARSMIYENAGETERHLGTHTRVKDGAVKAGIIPAFLSQLMQIFVELHDIGYTLTDEDIKNLKDDFLGVWKEIGLASGLTEGDAEARANQAYDFLVANQGDPMIRNVMFHGTTSIVLGSRVLVDRLGWNSADARALMMFFATHHFGFPLTLVDQYVRAGKLDPNLRPILMINEAPQAGRAANPELQRIKMALYAGAKLGLTGEQSLDLMINIFVDDRIAPTLPMGTFKYNAANGKWEYEDGDLRKKIVLVGGTNIKDWLRLTLPEIVPATIVNVEKEVQAAVAPIGAVLEINDISPEFRARLIAKREGILAEGAKNIVGYTDDQGNAVPGLRQVLQEVVALGESLRAKGFSGHLKDLASDIRIATQFYLEQQAKYGESQKGQLRPDENLLGILLSFRDDKPKDVSDTMRAAAAAFLAKWDSQVRPLWDIGNYEDIVQIAHNVYKLNDARYRPMSFNPDPKGDPTAPDSYRLYRSLIDSYVQTGRYQEAADLYRWAENLTGDAGVMQFKENFLKNKDIASAAKDAQTRLARAELRGGLSDADLNYLNTKNLTERFDLTKAFQGSENSELANTTFARDLAGGFRGRIAGAIGLGLYSLKEGAGTQALADGIAKVNNDLDFVIGVLAQIPARTTGFSMEEFGTFKPGETSNAPYLLAQYLTDATNAGELNNIRENPAFLKVLSEHYRRIRGELAAIQQRISSALAARTEYLSSIDAQRELPRDFDPGTPGFSILAALFVLHETPEWSTARADLKKILEARGVVTDRDLDTLDRVRSTRDASPAPGFNDSPDLMRAIYQTALLNHKPGQSLKDFTAAVAAVAPKVNLKVVQAVKQKLDEIVNTAESLAVETPAAAKPEIKDLELLLQGHIRPQHPAYSVEVVSQSRAEMRELQVGEAEAVVAWAKGLVNKLIVLEDTGDGPFVEQIQQLPVTEETKAGILELWNGFLEGNPNPVFLTASGHPGGGFSEVKTNKFVASVVQHYPDLQNRISFEIRMSPEQQQAMTDWIKNELLKGNFIPEDLDSYLVRGNRWPLLELIRFISPVMDGFYEKYGDLPEGGYSQEALRDGLVIPLMKTFPQIKDKINLSAPASPTGGRAEVRGKDVAKNAGAAAILAAGLLAGAPAMQAETAVVTPRAMVETINASTARPTNIVDTSAMLAAANAANSAKAGTSGTSAIEIIRNVKIDRLNATDNLLTLTFESEAGNYYLMTTPDLNHPKAVLYVIDMSDVPGFPVTGAIEVPMTASANGFYWMLPPSMMKSLAAKQPQVAKSLTNAAAQVVTIKVTANDIPTDGSPIKLKDLLTNQAKLRSEVPLGREDLGTAPGVGQPGLRSEVRQKVLLVEDEEDMVDPIRFHLEASLGHKVDHVNNAQDARTKIDEAAEKGEPYEIVIMDHNIYADANAAERDAKARKEGAFLFGNTQGLGLGLIKVLERKNPKLKFIFMSTENGTESRVDQEVLRMRGGMVGRLETMSKPFDPKSFMEKVETWFPSAPKGPSEMPPLVEPVAGLGQSEETARVRAELRIAQVQAAQGTKMLPVQWRDVPGFDLNLNQLFRGSPGISRELTAAGVAPVNVLTRLIVAVSETPAKIVDVLTGIAKIVISALVPPEVGNVQTRMKAVSSTSVSDQPGAMMITMAGLPESADLEADLRGYELELAANKNVVIQLLISVGSEAEAKAARPDIEKVVKAMRERMNKLYGSDITPNRFSITLTNNLRGAVSFYSGKVHKTLREISQAAGAAQLPGDHFMVILARGKTADVLGGMTDIVNGAVISSTNPTRAELRFAESHLGLILARNLAASVEKINEMTANALINLDGKWGFNAGKLADLAKALMAQFRAELQAKVSA